MWRIEGDMDVKLVSWKESLELVGVVAIVASLVFVGLQLRQSETATFVEFGLTLSGSEREELAVVFEHADIWVRGNAGEELDPTESVIYDGLIKITWSRVFWMNMLLREQEKTSDLTLHDFAWFLHKNSGARSAWSRMVDDEIERRDLLLSPTRGVTETHEYPEIIRKDLQKLDEIKR